MYFLYYIRHKAACYAQPLEIKMHLNLFLLLSSSLLLYFSFVFISIKPTYMQLYFAGLSEGLSQLFNGFYIHFFLTFSCNFI